MVARLLAEYRPIFIWGLGSWGLATLVGVVAAYLIGFPVGATVVTAYDLTALLLLLPWILGSVFAHTSRAASVDEAMTRSWQGASHDAVQRDIAEAMDGRRWTGSFATLTALIALVVVVLDVMIRLLFGLGFSIFPLLG